MQLNVANMWMKLVEQIDNQHNINVLLHNNKLVFHPNDSLVVLNTERQQKSAKGDEFGDNELLVL